MKNPFQCFFDVYRTTDLFQQDQVMMPTLRELATAQIGIFDHDWRHQSLFLQFLIVHDFDERPLDACY